MNKNLKLIFSLCLLSLVNSVFLQATKITLPQYGAWTPAQIGDGAQQVYAPSDTNPPAQFVNTCGAGEQGVFAVWQDATTHYPMYAIYKDREWTVPGTIETVAMLQDGFGCTPVVCYNSQNDQVLALWVSYTAIHYSVYSNGAWTNFSYEYGNVMYSFDCCYDSYRNCFVALISDLELSVGRFFEISTSDNGATWYCSSDINSISLTDYLAAVSLCYDSAYSRVFAAVCDFTYDTRSHVYIYNPFNQSLSNPVELFNGVSFPHLSYNSTDSTILATTALGNAMVYRLYDCTTDTWGSQQQIAIDNPIYYGNLATAEPYLVSSCYDPVNNQFVATWQEGQSSGAELTGSYLPVYSWYKNGMWQPYFNLVDSAHSIQVNNSPASLISTTTHGGQMSITYDSADNQCVAVWVGDDALKSAIYNLDTVTATPPQAEYSMNLNNELYIPFVGYDAYGARTAPIIQGFTDSVFLGGATPVSYSGHITTAHARYRPRVAGTYYLDYSMANVQNQASDSVRLTINVLDAIVTGTVMTCEFGNGPFTQELFLEGNFGLANVFNLINGLSTVHGGAVSIAQQDNNHYSPTWIVTYTPPTDYAGPDSFEFNVVERDSPYSIIATGTVSIEMINVPVAVDSTSDYVVPHLGSCPITLSCTSPLGLPLTFSLVQAPTKGGLSGIAQPINGGTLQTASLYYVPSRKAASSDSFAFRATPNGVNYSAPATIGISIAEDKPIALEQDQVDASSGLAVITLTATDAAGSRLNFKVSQPTDGGILSEVTQPRGSGSIQCAQVTYSIGLNNGSSDTFTFWVDNNSSISDSVTVNVLLA